ncbi:hypothetical protein [Micromonospora sp. WMMD1082]|uniref:hypothetical protein n=1 Tax=Micromonospora sp. WMMD1082 TaxID=3016104 RepID=UPI00241674A4|nr:hypothetical protein [Micromonospora sp. WMMD1082]MDG4796906.1 hypothetical protein [Micromonospora sp. WMMD1082]
MEESQWAVLIATLAGIVLGAGLQWMQAAWQARRERQREREGWAREDRRHWADERKRIYLDATDNARRQLNSYIYAKHPNLDPQGRPGPSVDPSLWSRRPKTPDEWVWSRSPEVLAEWGRLLTEVEFYGSDAVREALEGLELQLRMLEMAPAEDHDDLFNNAEAAYVESVANMRHDLGLSAGRKAGSRSSFWFLSVNLDQTDFRGEKGSIPPSATKA